MGEAEFRNTLLEHEVGTTFPPIRAGPEKVVPTVGFELTTYRLQGGCSTPELCGHVSAEDSEAKPGWCC